MYKQKDYRRMQATKGKKTKQKGIKQKGWANISKRGKR